VSGAGVAAVASVRKTSYLAQPTEGTENKRRGTDPFASGLEVSLALLNKSKYPGKKI